MNRQYMMVMDKETDKREQLISCLKKVISGSDWNRFGVKALSQIKEAKEFVCCNDVPIVFIGDGMDEMDAFGIIRDVREQKKRTNFIFVTDKAECIVHALRLNLRLSGCITQTPNCENVKEQLDNLWFPVELKGA